MPFLTDQCVNVLGVGVDPVDIARAITACEKMLATAGRGYVCVTGVHGVMEAQGDSEFRSILNSSFLTVPDGMPLVWIGRLLGYHGIRRTYGPDFMMEFCRHSVERSYRHFLYGGKAGVAEALASNLRQRLPGLQIVGTCTPPFRPLNSEEERDLFAQVTASKPDVIWVGLSTPKQEKFMAQYISRLDTKLLVGVGAAFDVHTGNIKDAPGWMKSAGLQWLHRLFQEPRRLWKRYLFNNPRFLLQIVLQLVGVTRYS